MTARVYVSLDTPDSPISLGPHIEQIDGVEEIEYGDDWLHLYRKSGVVSFPYYHVLKVVKVDTED